MGRQVFNVTYTGCIWPGVALLDAITPCVGLLALNGPSADAVECAGCPMSPPNILGG